MQHVGFKATRIEALPAIEDLCVETGYLSSETGSSVRAKSLDWVCWTATGRAVDSRHARLFPPHPPPGQRLQVETSTTFPHNEGWWTTPAWQ